MAAQCVSGMDTGEVAAKKKDGSAAVRGVLQQNRQFLDFFWDIAKPEQEVRLTATEHLIQYLRSSDQPDELKYTFKRLVEGLAASREAARPGFSLALAQVLQCFEEVPLSTILEHLHERYNLQTVKEKLVRNAAFGNFFGVLALFQSGRLAEDPKVLLQCVQLLQSLSYYREHLKDLPRKTLVDILSEIPESSFEEVLFGVLQSDLKSAFSTPEQLHLLLVGLQKFPGALKPKKLKKLIGSSTIVAQENIPKLVDLLKMAAKSVKKEKCLPGVALDVLRIAVKEKAFELFWTDVVELGLMEEDNAPCIYLCYRLLGAALPLLDTNQLQMILHGNVMLRYGEHVVSTQPADRFKFAPEMETYVDAFLENCDDPERQCTVLIGFSSLTNQGCPVVPSTWKVMRHVQPAALKKYIDWLKSMFLMPDIDSCLNFTTKRQRENQEQPNKNDHFLFRLRKWIIPRLVSIIDNAQVKTDESLVMDIARFILFHAFFEAKKSVSKIPETVARLSVPLDDKARSLVADAFFSLLLNLNGMPVLGEGPHIDALKEKHVVGVTADGSLWIHCMVRYADMLLSEGKVVHAVKPFSEEQKDAWARMLQQVEDLQKKAKKSSSMELSSYQQLLLLVGIHLLKTADESVELLNDIHNCLEKALSKKSKKKASDEPEWVEVMVEILLSLFSQPSRLFRVVSRNVFKKICPYLTKDALQLILNVFDPEEEESEESAIVITDDKDQKNDPEDQEEESSSDEESADEEDGDEDEAKESDGDDDDVSMDEDVNELFRKQLVLVLQGGKAAEGEDSDDDVDDETMMALDNNLAALFAEQKKRIQAKKDEKAKIREEKILRKDFKIKVLDLIEVFVTKQPDSPMVFSIIEPMISVIEQSMSSGSSQQEQDFLRKTADIFMNGLCKSKRYCKEVSELKNDLHDMMERLLQRASKQSDSSVALYCFSASLYLFKVLKGASTEQPEVVKKKGKKTEPSPQAICLGYLDLERVTSLYKEALQGFMTKRNSPLTSAMFVDLFNRFPFICKPLLGIIMKSVKDGARQHQQAQACGLLLKALQNPSLKQTLSPSERQDVIKEGLTQVTETLQTMEEIKVKVDQEKLIKCFELLNFLIKIITQQKLDISLKELPTVLQTLSQKEGFGKSVRLEDMYWNVMKLLGFTRPKKEKIKVVSEVAPEMHNNTSKKKGLLPETKKRKNRKKATSAEEKKASGEDKMEISEQQGNTKSKKKKNKKKKRKLEQEGGVQENSAKAPASKKAKRDLQNQGKSWEPAALEKTKKKKLKQNKGSNQENSKEASTSKKAMPNLEGKSKIEKFATLEKKKMKFGPQGGSAQEISSQSPTSKKHKPNAEGKNKAGRPTTPEKIKKKKKGKGAVQS
ncbi:myb-binding protein 1A [Anomaloglossus baeobatrachus]|uniref:myb-binding protein 1A n=1 Tax=Anomaloglossus baeobatrachus TaxID=238106 RepID=UPI003F4FB5F0